MKTIFTILFSLLITSLYGQRDFSDSETTKLVLLGTGTPFPNPLRSGCSIAIVVNDMPYIVDFGSGLIRKAAAMSESFGGNFKGLDVKNIKQVNRKTI